MATTTEPQPSGPPIVTEQYGDLSCTPAGLVFFDDTTDPDPPRKINTKRWGGYSLYTAEYDFAQFAGYDMSTLTAAEWRDMTGVVFSDTWDEPLSGFGPVWTANTVVQRIEWELS